MKKPTIGSTLSQILHHCIGVLSGIMLFLIFTLNLFYTAQVSRSGNEKFSSSPALGSTIPMLLILMAGILILSRIPSVFFEKANIRRIFLTLSVLYLVLGTYLIMNITQALRADPMSVYKAARAAAVGDYSFLESGMYLSRYPHQLGLMTWDMLLILFSPNPSFNFLMNLLLVIGINYWLLRISDQLFHSNPVNLITVVLSFAFLPQLFFITFAYGTIPGLFFLVMGFFFALRFMETGKLSQAVLTALSTGIATAIKGNYVIGMISIGICFLLFWMRSRKRAAALAMLFLCMAAILPKHMLIDYYSEKPEAQLHSGTPSVLWLAMGTDIDNRVRGPGWYDSSILNIYNESGFDSLKAAEAGKEKLQKNLQKIQADPLKAHAFFRDKVISQWCDPEYEALWSGPLYDMKQPVFTSLLSKLYAGKGIYPSLLAIFKFVSLSIWLMSLLFLLRYSRKHSGWEVFFLFTLGGFLFHLFWEGKSQYIYPYVIVLIPFAAFTVDRAIGYCRRSREEMAAMEKLPQEPVSDSEAPEQGVNSQ